MSIQTINPATEDCLETFEVYSQEQVDQALNEAREAFLSWRSIAFEERELAARIEAGGCFINGMSSSDPRLPFGGIKQSGYGRELSSFGIREFVNIQTVWIGPKVENLPTKITAE
ncbi:MAG TPA: aldehyde dehydrogenase family protein [Ktedonobacteraceae bacterium]|nr:aldehyde dehydrogenase family protein [Ktedonobacteraceae bacterium]